MSWSHLLFFYSLDFFWTSKFDRFICSSYRDRQLVESQLFVVARSALNWAASKNIIIKTILFVISISWVICLNDYENAKNLKKKEDDVNEATQICDKIHVQQRKSRIWWIKLKRRTISFEKVAFEEKMSDVKKNDYFCSRRWINNLKRKKN